ncbi:hypothetical protein ELQ35_20565 [Peribacillus cavernae]|uniref:YwqI/YxiC family protein n=1 Tax=Peribacillus cavernae TaxID=1674310 RepID=A0A3S0W2N5_9BACI|nr:DUF5344 family protein [Peribacillus cavernae]MDQ0219756.1 hypothetical protein [Peribacillus cavernae]RUQ25174.1 hypothetical protein ELQ35_20565 [Peribacillus cavernae]
MSTKIQIDMDQIESSLAKLKAAATELETEPGSPISTRNQLDVVMKLNTINESLRQVLDSYKALLLNNIHYTNKAATDLIATDAQVANSIKESI